MKKKKLKIEKPKMVDMASMPIDHWIGLFMVSSMMVKAHQKYGKVPKAIGVKKECLRENKDGSGTLEFYAEF